MKATTASHLTLAASACVAAATRLAAELAWDGSVYQSGGDAGQVNKINANTRGMVRSFSGSHIDEPYGMDAAPDGKVYVANKDTDKVAVIATSGSVGSLFSSRVDDPRDVAVGPRYSPSSPASAQDAARGATNSEPELEVLLDGRVAPPLISLARSDSPASIGLRATDAEGDAVSFSLEVLESAPLGAAGAGPTLVDGGDGTATVTMDIPATISPPPASRPFGPRPAIRGSRR